MPNTGWLTKTLAMAGTTLAWLPVIAMVFITGAMLVRTRGVPL